MQGGRQEQAKIVPDGVSSNVEVALHQWAFM